MLAVRTSPLAGVSPFNAKVQPLAQPINVLEAQRLQATGVRSDLPDGLVRYLVSALQVLGLMKT